MYVKFTMTAWSIFRCRIRQTTIWTNNNIYHTYYVKQRHKYRQEDEFKI